MMFEAKAIMPVLHVTDMDVSVGFYTGTLGFEVTWRNPADGGGENCLLSWGMTELMLSTGSHLGGPPAMTGTLYFGGSGVKELYEQVKGRVTMVWPLSDMEYGTREFGIRDPDGYLLAFAEELPC
jgi:catechol 2,3-dioxygenase-like lactoylglutathione lyase family enzyme